MKKRLLYRIFDRIPLIRRHLARVRALEAGFAEQDGRIKAMNGELARRIALEKSLAEQGGRLDELTKKLNAHLAPPLPPPVAPEPLTKNLNDLVEWCKKYRRLYIFGVDEKAQLLLKFFDNIGVTVSALLTENEKLIPKFTPTAAHEQATRYFYREIEISYPNALRFDDNTGVIVACNEKANRNAAKLLEANNCREKICLSDGLLNKISGKMRPRIRELFGFEINLVDHCNLNCQCCDHFSQVAKPRFLSLESFERDIKRLAQLTGAIIAEEDAAADESASVLNGGVIIKRGGRIGDICLLGGEPLLHPEAAKFFGIARAYFPHTRIEIITNGLLLPKQQGEFWEECKKQDIIIEVTEYPIDFDYVNLQKTVKQKGIRWHSFHDSGAKEKTSSHFVLNFDGGAIKHDFINCRQFNRCTVLRDGKIYACPLLGNIGIFNEAFGVEVPVGEADCVDIHKAGSYYEIAEYLSNRVPFCGYCDRSKIKELDWKTSSRTVEEYVDIEDERTQKVLALRDANGQSLTNTDAYPPPPRKSRPAFYLKINNGERDNYECFWHWVRIAQESKADIYVLCDNDRIRREIENTNKQINTKLSFICSERAYLSKACKNFEMRHGKPDNVVAYALLTPFVHAAKHGVKAFWNIDADDTVLFAKPEVCSRVLNQAADYADKNKIDCFSLDMCYSGFPLAHWSFGVTYTKMEKDYIHLLEITKPLKAYSDCPWRLEDRYNIDDYFNFLGYIHVLKIGEWYVENLYFEHLNTWRNTWKDGRIRYAMENFNSKSKLGFFKGPLTKDGFEIPDEVVRFAVDEDESSLNMKTELVQWARDYF
jgi:organic radical activating enzyme